MRTAEWSDSVSVLDRLTAVFDAFDDRDDGVGVTELARRANLPKSTVSRIASELVEQRLLEREGHKLFLGVRLYEFGQNVDEPRRLRRIALPIMAELRDLTGRTATLALVHDAEVLHIAVIRPRLTDMRTAGVGTRVPAASSALGRAVLDFTGPASAARASHVVRDECGDGLVHVATPVVSNGVPIAALSLYGPGAESDIASLTEVLQRAAKALGHRASASRSS